MAAGANHTGVRSASPRKYDSGLPETPARSIALRNSSDLANSTFLQVTHFEKNEYVIRVIAVSVDVFAFRPSGLTHAAMFIENLLPFRIVPDSLSNKEIWHYVSPP